jgi:type II secretory pathway pseudopilin PulG
MFQFLNALVWHTRRRLRSDGGFTLIEVMVAAGILFVTLTALAYVALIGFSNIALARERQSANGLANQTMEQMRALPFNTLKNGLSNTDLTFATTAGDAWYDANIKKNACGSGTTYCFNGEEIPRGTIALPPTCTADLPAACKHTGIGTGNVPLIPHRQRIVVGPNTYTVLSYVTYYNNVKTSNTFRLTVFVSWSTSAQQGVAHQVETQSITYSATGCLSTNTHPYAAPCQPFFYANAKADNGHIDVTGTINGIDSFQQGSLLLTSESSNLQIEQVTAVQGLAQMSGLSLVTDSTAASGQQKGTSAADTDPAAGGLNDYVSSLVVGSASSQSASGSGDTITLTPSSPDTGSTTSTVNANTTGAPPHTCPLTGVSQNDSQACGSSTARQVNNLVATLNLQHSINLGNVPLASVAGVASPGSTFVNRDLQASPADGLVHSDVTRSLGTVQIAGLPTGLSGSAVPVGWAGYFIQLSGVTNTVSAETGTSTAAPAVTLTGTLKYWNGAGYTTVTLAPGAAANLPVKSVNISDLSSGKLLQVKIEGLSNTDCLLWVEGCPTTGGTSTSSTSLTCSPTPCPNTRTAATASAASPFVGDIHYSIIYDGETQADVIIHVDLGTILAQNTYQVPPSAT